MTYLEEIKAELASIAPGYKARLRGFPEDAAAWVLRSDANTSGVFFCLPIASQTTIVYEEFSNIRLETLEIQVDGKQQNCLVLHCLDHTRREMFALVCSDFLDPKRRQFISESPSTWWSEWSDLLGNSNSEQSPHSIVAEMLVLKKMVEIGIPMDWSGPNGSTHDLIGKEFDFEVKSTLKRHGKRITISSEHQLSIASGKRLFLAFVRLEFHSGGESVNTLIEKLNRLGWQNASTEANLTKMGCHIGKGIRNMSYLLHEAELYEVTDSFPRISPKVFIDGVLPKGVENIKYEVDLSLLNSFSSLDNFSI
jgi:hypothetical protein